MAALKSLVGAREVAQQFRILDAFAVWFPAFTGWLTTIGNLNSREPDILSGLCGQQVYIQCIHKHVGKHSDT